MDTWNALRKELENRETVLVAGHRGMKALYPENTLFSFQKALDAGVDMLELDIRLTKDKCPVVIHDQTVDRTTDGTGLVSSYSLKELKKLDAGSALDGFHGLEIPTLEEFCDWMANAPALLLNVEIKERSRETADLTLRMLERANLAGRCVFTCFDADIVAYMADAYGVLTQGFPGEMMENFQPGKGGTYEKLYAVGIEMGKLTPERAAFFEGLGILPWCYCPDTREEAEVSLACGARLMTANNPIPAMEVLEKRGLRKH